MIVNPNPDIEIISIDHVEILVVDNLLIDPMALRNYAAQCYTDVHNPALQEHYEFIERKKIYQIYPRLQVFQVLFPGLCAQVVNLIIKHISPNIRAHFNVPPDVSQINLSKGPYFNAVHQSPIFLPHVDAGHVSSFLYLNPAELCWGGTAIYRHIPSNRITVDQQQSDVGWLTKTPLTKPLTTSTDEWRLEKMVEMKFNRLVVFNSSTIHKIYWPDDDGPFEKDFLKTRLTLNNFFTYAV